MFWRMEDIPGSCFLQCIVQLSSAAPRLPTSGAHRLIRAFSPKAFCFPIKCFQGKENPDAEEEPESVPTMYQWGWLPAGGWAHVCSCLVQQAKPPTPPGHTAEQLPSILPCLSMLFWHCLFITRLSWYQLIIKCSTCAMFWHMKPVIYWPNNWTALI